MDNKLFLMDKMYNSINSNLICQCNINYKINKKNIKISNRMHQINIRDYEI